MKNTNVFITPMNNSFLRRCDNKTKSRCPTAAIFVDGRDFFFIYLFLFIFFIWYLDNWPLGEHSDQVLKNPPSGLGGVAITANVYIRTDRRTEGRTDRRTPQRPHHKSSTGLPQEELKKL